MGKCSSLLSLISVKDSF